jgi:hypothetical protein
MEKYKNLFFETLCEIMASRRPYHGLMCWNCYIKVGHTRDYCDEYPPTVLRTNFLNYAPEIYKNEEIYKILTGKIDSDPNLDHKSAFTHLFGANPKEPMHMVLTDPHYREEFLTYFERKYREDSQKFVDVDPEEDMVDEEMPVSDDDDQFDLPNFQPPEWFDTVY